MLADEELPVVSHANSAAIDEKVSVGVNENYLNRIGMLELFQAWIAFVWNSIKVSPA